MYELLLALCTERRDSLKIRVLCTLALRPVSLYLCPITGWPFTATGSTMTLKRAHDGKLWLHVVMIEFSDVGADLDLDWLFKALR